VVIAAVGLVLSSSIQKAQIKSSEALGRANIEIARLKNDDDRRLEENKFASDMLQNLLSDEPRHRKFAIIMLRRTVEPAVYEELLSGIAFSDPATDVRQDAIRQLGYSRNPSVAIALNTISSDPSRPKEERALADSAKSNVAVVGTLSEGSCAFFASSSGTHAFESVTAGGGLFRATLIDGLKNESPGGISLGDLAYFLKAKLPARALADIGQRQEPVVNCEGVEVEKGLLFSRPTVALLAGVGKYADPNLMPLISPERDESALAAILEQRGANVTQLLNATRSQILSAAAHLGDSCGSNMDCVLYYSGHGFSIGGEGYLMAYDSRVSGNPMLMRESSVSIQQLMAMLKQHVGQNSRLILFFDMDTSDIASGR